jgi:phosphatidate cytidylyltransferase
MKRVLTALVLIPLVLLAVFRAPDWLFTLLVGVVAVLATIEYLQIAAKYGYKVYPVVTVGVIALMFISYSLVRFDLFEIVVVVLVVTALFVPSLMLALGMRADNLRDALPGAALSYFAIPYVGLSMLCLAWLRAMVAGWFFVLFTFFAVWVGDTAAYYVGRSVGKTKFAARVSPKKTWEGAIASILGAMIVGVVFALYAPTLHVSWLAPVWSTRWWIPAVIALVINVAAQLGDLFESLIKRGADVKDSGTMLPGHGGILDRIDALLFAAPVALVMFMIWGERFSKTT